MHLEQPLGQGPAAEVEGEFQNGCLVSVASYSNYREAAILYVGVLILYSSCITSKGGAHQGKFCASVHQSPMLSSLD
jgi:hypothetical protein